MNPLNKEYARVVNGKIVECPVMQIHILNRGQSLDMYTEVLSRAKPDVTPWEYLTVLNEIFGDKVLRTWSKHTMSPIVFYGVMVRQMIAMPNEPTHKALINEKLPELIPYDKAVTDKLFDGFNICLEKWIVDISDAYAVAKGYASGDRLISFVNDPNEVWRAEATEFIAKRSAAYALAYSTLTLDKLVTDGQIVTNIMSLMRPILALFAIDSKGV